MNLNDIYFQNLQKEFRRYPDIYIQNNILYYNGHTLDLTDISLQSIFGESEKAQEAFKTMNSNDFFAYLQVEVMGKKSILNEVKTFETMKETDPIIKDLSIVELQNANGEMKRYVHFIDEAGIDHVLFQYAPGDVLKVYQNLVHTKGASITAKDLYRELERKMKEVNFVSSYNAQNVYEDFQKEIQNHEANVNVNGDYARINEEHEMIVSNHSLYSTTHDSQGNLVRQESKMASQNDVANISVSNTTDTIGVFETKEQERVLLLSEKQFLSLLHCERKYTPEEEQQITFYYSFLFELMKYRDFLTEDLYRYLVHYENEILMMQTNIKDNLNENERNAVQKYFALDEKVKQQTIQIKNIDDFQRKRKLPAAGYVNGFGIVGITIVLGIILAFFLK